MSDKPPSLRHIFRRGRNKSGEADDTSDSNSDSSRLKPDVNNGEDTLPPPLPSTQGDGRSPSARVPKKLQKKRSNINSSAMLAPPMSSEQCNKSPSSETVEPTVITESRREIRRKQRRQPELAATTRSRKNSESARLNAPDTTFGLASHNGEFHDASSRQLIKAVKSFVSNENYNEINPNVEPICANSDIGDSESAELYGASPMSTKSEPVTMGEKPDNISERRNSINLAPQEIYVIKAIKNSDNTDPSSTGTIEARRRRKKRLGAPRTPSPVSPPQERGIKSTDSPVSLIQVSKNNTNPKDEAPLLPHERMISTGNSDLPTSESNSAIPTAPTGFLPLSSIGNDPQKGKLQKNSSHKSKIPTPTKADKESEARNEPPTALHDAASAKAALLKTLQKMKDKEHSADHDLIKTAREEVLRDAATFLELGPNPDPSPPPPPPPSAPEVPSPDNNSPAPFVPRALTRALRSRDAPGSERVAHPVNVLYDKPINLQGGIQQRGFRRWRCCRCESFTHYENHVCSRLDCVHVRCEGSCEMFEP